MRQRARKPAVPNTLNRNIVRLSKRKRSRINSEQNALICPSSTSDDFCPLFGGEKWVAEDREFGKRL